MRKINGFVCIAEVITSNDFKREILFGVNVNLKDLKGKITETLQSNGLIPFSNLQMAEKAQKELIASKMFKKVRIAEIAMQLTETMKDVPFFIKRKNLIVVAVIEESGMLTDMRLMGTYVEGKCGQYPLPGALLEFNGFKPFSNFESAEYVASEAKRQMDCRVLIGTFTLKRLKQ